MPRAPFDLYIFDLDGTLVDSRVDLAHAVNVARAALGLPTLSVETVAGYVGEGVAVLMQRAMGPEHQDLVPRATELFRAHYAEHLVDHTRAFDGAPALLAELRARGAHVAVATNKPERFSRKILDALGLAPHVEALVGGDTLAQRKPDPLPLQHLCARFEVPAARALMIGDSPVDVAAARAAGVPVCAVEYGIGAPHELARLAPDFFAAHPADVLNAEPRG